MIIFVNTFNKKFFLSFYVIILSMEIVAPHRRTEFLSLSHNRRNKRQLSFIRDSIISNFMTPSQGEDFETTVSFLSVLFFSVKNII